MTGALVRIDRVSQSFGLHQVLDDVSIRLEAGGVYCLMGPSGAGKTSLLRLLMGLDQPTHGAVIGVEPGEVSAMFQEDRLREMLTPIENVALVHPDRRISRRAIREDLVGILPERSLDQPVIELSGGMRRRVSLACAMTYPGRFIVLDEPFTGLDGATKREVIGYLLRRRGGRTLLATTHHEEDVELLSAEKLTLGGEMVSDEA